VSNDVRAILDQGTSFQGQLSFDGVVRVAGEFKGEVQSPKGTLIVESGGKVKAKVYVQTLILHGFLEGEVKASEQVRMHPPAHFVGTVESPSLKIDEGVIFEGSSLHSKKNS